MSDIAIRVENLGKKYKIGANQARYQTLRESIMSGVSSSLGHLKGSQPKEDNIIWALKDINFEVKHGEVLGIIGRNGAGKSTLLKILSRITRPTTGRFELNGRVGSLLEVGTGFHPELTGRDNIYLSGAILGMKRKEINRKFDEIVDFAEIEKFLDTPVKHYSSGMYMRLAFAVAAHLEPEILLVDEVLAVGDAEFQKKCLGKMGDVAGEGRTVLFVSHNMGAIQSLCLKSLLIENGKIVSEGKSNDIVQLYIDTNQTKSLSTDLIFRKDRSGDGTLKIRKIIIGLANNKNCGYWKTGDDCSLTLFYTCKKNLLFKNIEIAIGIRRMDQTRLLYLGTKVTKQNLEYLNCSSSSECIIKKLPLEPGKYSLSVEVKVNGIIVDYVNNAISVNVEFGDFFGTGIIWPYGCFLCEYSWSHEMRWDNDTSR